MIFDRTCGCLIQVVREIDDHADIIAVEMVTDCTPYGGKSANLVSSSNLSLTIAAIYLNLFLCADRDESCACRGSGSWMMMVCIC